jgi:hypothetical protein
MRRILLLATVAAIAVGTFSAPAAQASPISTAYAKRVINRYIERNYSVALRPLLRGMHATCR